MGIVNRNAISRDLPGWLRSIGNDLKDTALEDGFKVGEDAVKTIRQVIDTTPSALSPGKIGRNWSGHMRSRVDYKITQKGNQVEVTFGWTNMRRAEEYIAEQELGSARVATGMGAMTIAAIQAQTTLKNKGYK